MTMYIGVETKDDVLNGRNGFFVPARFLKGKVPTCLEEGDFFYLGSGQRISERDKCYSNFKDAVGKIVGELKAVKTNDEKWVRSEVEGRYRIDCLGDEFTGMISVSFGRDPKDYPSLEMLRFDFDLRFGRFGL